MDCNELELEITKGFFGLSWFLCPHCRRQLATEYATDKDVSKERLQRLAKNNANRHCIACSTKHESAKSA